MTPDQSMNTSTDKLKVSNIVKRFGENLAGKTIALWGLAFKPNTDDMREAPSLVLIDDLTKRGAKIVAFDPVAMHEAQQLVSGEHVQFAESAMAALAGADALAIVTEWKTFRAPDFAAMKSALKAPIVFDGRNLYEPEVMAENGFEYYPIGRRQSGNA